MEPVDVRLELTCRCAVMKRDTPEVNGAARPGSSRSFALVWVALTTSRSGSAVTLVALPLVALVGLHASPLAIGLLSSFQTLPSVLIRIPAGHWADRVRRQTLVLVSADLSRAITVAAVPVLYVTDSLSVTLLLAIAVIQGSLTAIFDAFSSILLPRILPPDRLVRGNARLSAGTAGAEVAGPAAGSLLIQLVGAPLSLLADSVSYLGSAICLSRVRTTLPTNHPAGAEMPSEKHWTMFRLLLYTHRQIVFTSVIYNVLGGATAAILAPFVVQTLQLRPSFLGLILAAGAVGGVVSSVTLSCLTTKAVYGMTRCGGIAIVVSLWLLLISPVGGAGLATAIASELLGSAGAAAYMIFATTHLQTATWPNHLARTMSAFAVVAMGSVSMGALVGGALASASGLRVAIGLFAAAALASTPLLRRLPSPGTASTGVVVHTGVPAMHRNH